MYQTYAICYSILTILARYRQAMAYGLLFFYSSFSLLSLHFIHFSCLSFFLRHQAPFFSSFTLFSSQSRCFSLFLSDITLCFFFSLFSSFTPISVAVVFFFFWVVIWYSIWQWVGWDGDWRITGGGLRWSNSMVGGSVGGGDSGWVCGMRWWWVLLCEISCGRTGLWMGSEVWVVGGWVGSDNGWVCGMRWVGGWRRLCFDFGVFFFFFLIIYKVVLVDMGLCRWWLSALLQPRWLCCCWWWWWWGSSLIYYFNVL